MKPLLLFLGDLGGGELLLVMVFLIPLGLLYFLPSIIGRKRPDFLIILLVNLLAGWSIIGWFIALYLAVRRQTSLAPTAYATGATSVADELSKLRDLRDQGVITSEEFERQKNNLLS